MATVKTAAPPDELRDRIEYRDGKLYWRDMPENKHGLARTNGLHIGAGTNTKGTNYQRLRFEGERYAVHRVVYWIFTNEWPEVVDHINRNRHDNRIENLRAATTQENALNTEHTYSLTTRKISTGETRYYPKLYLMGECFSIGVFKDELTALYAAWKMRDLMFPGFAPMPVKLAELTNLL